MKKVKSQKIKRGKKLRWLKRDWQLYAMLAIPIILAILLNEMRMKRFKKFSQTLLYLPHFLSWVFIGGMVLKIFAPTSGAIKATLLKAGWIGQNRTGGELRNVESCYHWLRKYCFRT